MMIIVLELCYEVMNCYVLLCQLSFILLYVPFTYCLYFYPYHDLMV
jgi:hypothetical protein